MELRNKDIEHQQRENYSKKFSLIDGRTITVLDRIGEGGQGRIYRVRIDETGEEKALKWYFPKCINEPRKFYTHLVNNIKTGSPSEMFVWPEQLTDWYQGSFGYTMSLIPKQYINFSMYLTGGIGFYDVDAMISAALQIVSAFCELHNKGYNYQDLNDGNFAINPQTGDTLICDSDNVMGHGQFSGIRGKLRYMAPEIVRGETNPDKSTDRFSLAVILFMLLIGDHPLEGKKTHFELMTNSRNQKSFGDEPVFIYDEINDSNRPIPELHKNACSKWKYFPSYIKNAFQQSFSRESLLQGGGRLTEQTWRHLLIRLKSSVVNCPYCQEQIFLETERNTICPACHNEIRSAGYLHFPTRGNVVIDVPIYSGVRLYEYHTGSDFDSYENEIATILSKPDKFGLKNESNCTWNVSNSIGKAAQKPPGVVAVLRDGFKIDFGQNGSVAKVILNKD